MNRSARVVVIAAILIGFSGWASPKAVLGQNSGQADSAAITGHVTVGGKGAGGVIIVLMKVPTDARKAVQQMLTEGTGGTKTTTDIDGSYRFSGVQSGHYMVSPFAPTFSARARGAQETEVTVNEGDVIGAIDFTLERGGVITGRITTPDGRPVIAASVSATPDTGSPDISPRVSMSLASERSNTTDDRGIYRLYGLPAGKYTVRVTQASSARASSDEHPTYYPGVADPASAGKVDVTPGTETAGIDIKVTPHGSSIYRASGRVTDESGNPVAGARVVYGAATGQGRSFDPNNAPVTTNSAGEFHIQGLRDGSYQASVFSGFGQDSDEYSEATSFDIKDSDASGIEIRLHQGGTVSGTVTLDGTPDADAMGKLAQQQVSGMVFSSPTGSMGFNRSPIGSDGSFTLRGLPPGQVQINLGEIWNLGSSNPFRVIRVEQDGAAVQDGVKLDAGQHLSGVKVVVAYANCSISGSVTITGGKLPPGTGLTVMAVRETSAGDGDTEVFTAGGGLFGGENTAQVDGGGQFQITGLAPGTYTVRLEVSGPAWSRASAARPNASKSVTVTSGNEAQVQLELDVSSSGNQKNQ